MLQVVLAYMVTSSKINLEKKTNLDLTQVGILKFKPGQKTLSAVLNDFFFKTDLNQVT